MDALSAVLLPLSLALLAWPQATRAACLRLAAWAPLPALALALLAPEGLTREFPGLLLGTRLGVDATGRLFLAFSALVWLAAGQYARGYLRHDPRRHVFWFFFLAAQAGSLGLSLAWDAASFYTLFTLMTFAAWGLVVHNGDAAARRAARVYLVMALAGEAALLAGLILAARAADSLLLADMASVAVSPPTVALLIAGFGVKAGLPLLHMWLPLAHPIAPVPASAVLSGVMIKAGLLGWLRCLPLGEQTLPGAGGVLMVMGLAAVFFGVALGLAQRDVKTLLAYSSVSQMGYMTLGVGAGLLAPAQWPALLAAVGLYAAHHALAKGALFLGVGVLKAHGGGFWVLAGLCAPALALAGAPFTSGLLAKTELKAGLAGLAAPWADLLPALLMLGAFGTALLMIRLLWLSRAQPAGQGKTKLEHAWWLLFMITPALPWSLAAPSTRAAVLLPEALPALLPLAAALLVSALALRLKWRAPDWPAGDLLILCERLGARIIPQDTERGRRP